MLFAVCHDGQGVGEAVAHHAEHIGLDDGLEPGEVGGIGGGEVVPALGVEGGIVATNDLRAVVLDEGVAAEVLVESVVVLHGPGAGVGGVEEVLAEGHIWPRAANGAEEGWHDVDLLGHGGTGAAGQPAGGVVDEDGHAEDAEGVGVGGVGGVVGMVGGDDEDGVAEPGLAASGGEEAAEGEVGVADAGVDGVARLAEGLAVALGNDEGVVGGGGEEGGAEGLAEGGGLGGEVLEELLVPDGPGAVEVGGAAETGVGLVLGAAVVVLEAGGAGEGLEAHGAVVGTMEEGGGVALVAEFGGEAAHLVEAVGGDDEGFDEHGDG